MTTVFEVSQQRNRDERRPYNPQIDGGLAALRRAAYKARKRAIALDGYVATWRDGKIVYDTEP